MKLNDKIRCILCIRYKNKGFTLPELLVAILVVGILAALALPAIDGYLDKRRIIAAAEEIYSQLHFARSETLKQSNSINVNFVLNTASPSASWGLGISTNSCNPNIINPATINACVVSVNGTNVIKRTSSADFPDVLMATPNFNAKVVGGVATQETGFEPIRGITVDSSGIVANGTIILTSNNYQMNVIVAPIGRIKIISPAGSSHVAGYPTT